MNLGNDLPRVRRAAVFGLARSGRAVIEALVERDVAIIATDSRDAASLGDLPSSPLVRYELGAHRPSTIQGVDVAVVSPGVPLDHAMLRMARERGIPVIPEFELASRLLAGPVVAITGTNGKSTTTSLCAALIAGAGRRAVPCGNLGVPWAAYATAAHAAARDPETVWVVELSSFQLEGARRFAPDVAVHLNLSPDHLDRHGTLAAYAAAKARIFADQRADQLAVLNADDPAVSALPVRARRATFSRRSAVRPGAWLDAGSFVSNLTGRVTRFAERDDLRLAGTHNEENALAALAASIPFGVTPETVAAAFREFRPLPHRLALVRVVGGVSYYDDSKGTNVDAAMKSLEGMPDGRVLLILGGKKKNDDFTRMRPLVAQKARMVLAIGATQDEIVGALAPTTPVVSCGTLESAVARARGVARPGDVVLLSPACASFDQFRNFEHRGEVFERLVRALPDTAAEPSGVQENR